MSQLNHEIWINRITGAGKQWLLVRGLLSMAKISRDKSVEKK